MAPGNVRKQWAAFIQKGEKRQAPSQAVTGRRRFTGVVLGVDPSLRATGLAVLSVDRSERFACLHATTIRVNPSQSLAEALALIGHRMNEVLDAYSIDESAFEESIYVQNYQTAMILGAARGAAISAVSMRGLPVFHYPPLRIKQAVVGYGRASKEQVQKSVSGFLGYGATCGFDQSDAAAVALCHSLSGSLAK